MFDPPHGKHLGCLFRVKVNDVNDTTGKKNVNKPWKGRPFIYLLPAYVVETCNHTVDGRNPAPLGMYKTCK